MLLSKIKQNLLFVANFDIFVIQFCCKPLVKYCFTTVFDVNHGAATKSRWNTEKILLLIITRNARRFGTQSVLNVWPKHLKFENQKHSTTIASSPCVQPANCSWSFVVPFTRVHFPLRVSKTTVEVTKATRLLLYWQASLKFNRKWKNPSNWAGYCSFFPRNPNSFGPINCSLLF